MLKLFFDQDFNHNILRGLTKRIPELDWVTAHQIKRGAEKDETHLAWASDEKRIILTHDVNTFPKFAYERIKNSEKMSGVIVVPQTMPIGRAIDELEVIVTCSFEGELENLILFLPFNFVAAD